MQRELRHATGARENNLAAVLKKNNRKTGKESQERWLERCVRRQNRHEQSTPAHVRELALTVRVFIETLQVYNCSWSICMYMYVYVFLQLFTAMRKGL